MNQRISTAAAALLIGLAIGPTAWAEDGHHDHGVGGAHEQGAVGASVDDLIAIARRMNPDLQVSALEADAAAAKVEGAGSLADPKVQAVVMDWPRSGPGYLPSNPLSGTTKKIYVSQELPFWGKRDLKREIAEAGARKAAAMKKQLENELVAKIKVAYAEYHSAHLVGDMARNLRSRMDTLAKLAGARYAQTQGRQEDVTLAQVEKSALETEIARTDADRHRARVKINRLLGRDLEAPLVEAPAPRPIPPEDQLVLDRLTERAQSANPDLLVQQATIEGAGKSVDLAERDWYPDFEVTVGAVKSQGDWSGYEAMVTANVPLQWGLHESEIGEAKAMAGAARSKREAVIQDIGNDLAESWIGLKSARQVETLLRENQLLQAEIGFQSAAKAYQLGRTGFLDVLSAEQQLWKTDIDLIKVRFEEQMRLAEIEKLVGGDL